MSKPAYRLTVYAGRTVDPTETTALTPTDTSIHSDSFKVATMQGISGFQPYMGFPKGERGTIQLPDFKAEVGRFRIPLLDMSLIKGNNLRRWVTAFIGDATGKVRLKGRKVVIEESTDAGATWSLFFVGRLSDATLDDPLTFSIDVKDSVEDMKTKVFTKIPAVSYSVYQMLLPVGLSADYGSLPASLPMSASVTSKFITAGKQLSVSEKNRKDNVYTTDLQRASSAAGQDAANLPTVYVRKTATGATGTFSLGTVTSFSELGGVFANQTYVAGLNVMELPASHPAYTAKTFLSTNDSVTFTVVAPPSEGDSKQPTVILGDVHPVQVWKDLLDGQFSATSGSTIPYDSASFAALLADQTIPPARFVITKQQQMVDFIEEAICKPYSLGFTIVPGLVGGVPQGIIKPFKTNLPASLPSVTLTDTDVIATDNPTWSAGDPYNMVTVTHYVDIPQDVQQQSYRTGNDVTLFTEQDWIVGTYDGSDPDAPPKALKIDASGVRATSGDTMANQARQVWAQATARKLLAPYAQRYGYGAAEVELPCRRTANVLGLTVGDWVLVDVDKLPDSATHLRGGVRLMQVTGKSEEGLSINVTLLDGALNSAWVTPSVGVLTLANDTIAVPVTTTQNVNVHVQYAVTPKTDAIPIEASALWTTAEFIQLSSTTGSATIRDLPLGMRVYVRVRAESLPSVDLRLPSAWVSPTVTYVDLPNLTTPTGLTVAGSTRTSATIVWTNTDTNSLIEVQLKPNNGNQDTYAYIEPGSSAVFLSPLSPDVAANPYTVYVRYFDGLGGFGGYGSLAFSVTGSVAQCPSLKAFYVNRNLNPPLHNPF